MKLYSTYDSKNFFIKKDSTLPILKLPLIQSIREQYDITEEMLTNVAVTFSMKDSETGIYRIANTAGDLDICRNRQDNPDEVEYTLTYKFNLLDTKRVGRFEGEFKLDFLGDYCGKITLPNNTPIQIFISDSITKTTVV